MKRSRTPSNARRRLRRRRGDGGEIYGGVCVAWSHCRRGGWSAKSLRLLVLPLRRQGWVRVMERMFAQEAVFVASFLKCAQRLQLPLRRLRRCNMRVRRRSPPRASLARALRLFGSCRRFSPSQLGCCALVGLVRAVSLDWRSGRMGMLLLAL